MRPTSSSQPSEGSNERTDLELVLDVVLDYGLDDWVMAVDVNFMTKEVLGLDDRNLERTRALEVIRLAVEGGWMRLGDVVDGEGFQPWDLDAEAALKRVRSDWEGLGHTVGLYEVCWLENTERGDDRARKLPNQSE